MENNKAAETSYIIADLVQYHRISTAIGSPGSRNLPLLTAFNNCEHLKLLPVIVDERSAAFSALGIATTKREPVVIICTSGSALLNYAPAIAEAYYSSVPLVIISADRPLHRLNRGECQMIDQSAPLKSITSYQTDIFETDNTETVAIKTFEALRMCSLTSRPVHINVRFADDFDTVLKSVNKVSDFTISDYIHPENDFSTQMVRSLSHELSSPKKVMVIVGPMTPDRNLTIAIKRLTEISNIVVVAEPLSNLHDCYNVIYNFDKLHKENTLYEDLYPQAVVTLGAPPTSKALKKWLRKARPLTIWQVGNNSNTLDFIGAPSLIIDGDPVKFIRRLSSAMLVHTHKSDYSKAWHKLDSGHLNSNEELMQIILNVIPDDCNIHFSNGLTVRQASVIPPHHHRYFGNRGVNGIDGTTSTAIGSAYAYSKNTILITGDMSANYDMSAWISPLITSRFRAIVIDNGGGGIFRTISPSNHTPEAELLACASHFTPPLAKIAEAAGFTVDEITDEDPNLILNSVNTLCSASRQPKLLIIKQTKQSS